MRVLIHIGLNKCASTYVQEALDMGRPVLQRAGVWYPRGNGAGAHYGLSRHYGFGPDAPEVRPESLGTILAEARRRGCRAAMISSEYLSLHRPAAADRLVADLAASGARAEIVMLSRDVGAWIRSLFNQYVRTVTGPGALDDINAFVDQILRNRAGDIAGRYAMWEARLGRAALAHYRIAGDGPAAAVLAPFEHFAGCALEHAPARRSNVGIDEARLHRIGALQRQPASPARDRALSMLGAGLGTVPPAPRDYLEIDAERRARIRTEIGEPYEALPWAPLPARPAPALAALQS